MQTETISIGWNDPPISIGQVHFSFKSCVGGIFHFYLNFDRTFCKQSVETLTRHRVMGLHCLPLSHKKTLGLWLGQFNLLLRFKKSLVLMYQTRKKRNR